MAKGEFLAVPPCCRGSAELGIADEMIGWRQGCTRIAVTKSHSLSARGGNLRSLLGSLKRCMGRFNVWARQVRGGRRGMDAHHCRRR